MPIDEFECPWRGTVPTAASLSRVHHFGSEADTGRIRGVNVDFLATLKVSHAFRVTAHVLEDLLLHQRWDSCEVDRALITVPQPAAEGAQASLGHLAVEQ
jgi:hypothetical protein